MEQRFGLCGGIRICVLKTICENIAGTRRENLSRHRDYDSRAFHFCSRLESLSSADSPAASGQAEAPTPRAAAAAASARPAGRSAAAAAAAERPKRRH